MPTPSTRPGCRPRRRSPRSTPPATGATTRARWTSSPATTTSTPPGLELLDDRGRPRPRRRRDWPAPPPRRPHRRHASFTELPAGLPPRSCAPGQRGHRATPPTAFEKAVALQEWFRRERRLHLRRPASPPATAPTTWSRFLTDGHGGRTGYCEQFAAAMAVMARALGIPARVAVGFLQPEQIGADTWEYSAHDLHAWPELYFAGRRLGALRAHPGAAARQRCPAYTRSDLPGGRRPEQPDRQRRPASEPTAPRAASAPSTDPGRGRAADERRRGSGFPWLRCSARLGGLVAARRPAGACCPLALRRRRRERRLAGRRRGGLGGAARHRGRPAARPGPSRPLTPRDPRRLVARLLRRPPSDRRAPRSAARTAPDVAPRGGGRALDRIVRRPRALALLPRPTTAPAERRCGPRTPRRASHALPAGAAAAPGAGPSGGRRSVLRASSSAAPRSRVGQAIGGASTTSADRSG